MENKVESAFERIIDLETKTTEKFMKKYAKKYTKKLTKKFTKKYTKKYTKISKRKSADRKWRIS